MIKEIWEAAAGKILMCETEPRNVANRYAVAINKDRSSIWHLTKKRCRMFSHFSYREEESFSVQ